jgi:hypothetical protein
MIIQHVMERDFHLVRSLQCPSKVSISQHRSPATHHFVKRLSYSNRQPLHATRERTRIMRLSNDVQVISLNGIMNQAKPKALAPPDERAVNPAKGAIRSQVPHFFFHTKYDVDRVYPRKRRARAMWHRAISTRT